VYTNSTQQRHYSETNSPSGSSKIARHEGNLKVNYRAHMIPPLDSILMNLVITIRFNIILPSESKSPKWSPFTFYDWNFVCISHLSHACYMPRPSYLDFIKLWRSSSLCAVFSSLLLVPLFQCQIFSSASCTQSHKKHVICWPVKQLSTLKEDSAPCS
jgi:hypothetical protein